MPSTPQEQPEPELHTVGDEVPGHSYETPLTLGPDSDHAGDPIRNDQQRDAIPAAPSNTRHEPTSDDPLNPA
jgi:hypothetical protein